MQWQWFGNTYQIFSYVWNLLNLFCSSANLAVRRLNEALLSGDMTTLLEALQSPALSLKDVKSENIDFYAQSLLRLRQAKPEVIRIMYQSSIEHYYYYYYHYYYYFFKRYDIDVYNSFGLQFWINLWIYCITCFHTEYNQMVEKLNLHIVLKSTCATQLTICRHVKSPTILMLRKISNKILRLGGKRKNKDKKKTTHIFQGVLTCLNLRNK